MDHPQPSQGDVPLLSVRGLTKRYGDHVVLDGVDLDVPARQKAAVIGASGSGKSTLLRLVMGLERPDGGSVRVEGEELWMRRRGGREVPADEAHLRRVRGKVGMVFQNFNLFPHLTVLENLTLAPVKVKGIPRAEAQEKARILLAQVGLEDKTGAYPERLSGGQKQRVAIARALALEPKLMLFDEVTSALDPELVGEVLEVVRDLAHRTDTTLLIVTHEMGFARDIADRVLFFDGGRIVEEGPPEVMFKEPREERTRRFLRAVLGKKTS